MKQFGRQGSRAQLGRFLWLFLNGRQFLRRLDGLLDFLLRRIHFGLDRPHFGIDGIPDVSYSLLERAQRIAEPFTQALHVSGRHSAAWL